MPRHLLSTGLFWVHFNLAAGRQEMLLQTVDENQTLQEQNKSLGSKFSPFTPHPVSLLAPGRGGIYGRKPLVPSRQLCSPLSLPWCPLAALAW